MRIAILGGGGFRVPIVYEAVRSIAGQTGVEEIALQDVSTDRLTRIADVIRGMRQECGDGTPVWTTTSLDEAVDGAAFVLCSIRVGGLDGRVIDEVVPLAHGVLGQETVGPGGIALALRTVPAMDRIALAVAERAPRAWFLNFTNPAGLVTEALRSHLPDRAVGICDSPAALCGRVAAALGRQSGSLRFDYAGLNHLGWLIAAWDEREDLLPSLLEDHRLLARIEEARIFGADEVRRLGLIPNEYLVYYQAADRVARTLRQRGTRAEIVRRQQEAFYRERWDSPREALALWRRAKRRRHRTYMAEARSEADEVLSTPAAVPGTAHDVGPGEAGYAAIAARFLLAVATDAPRDLILDLPNHGRMLGMPEDAVIEAPARIDARGPIGLPVAELPGPQRELVARVKDVERITIRAAREGSAALALDALAAHPLVPSRAVAERILADYLGRHDRLRAALR